MYKIIKNWNTMYRIISRMDCSGRQNWRRFYTSKESFEKWRDYHIGGWRMQYNTITTYKMVDGEWEEIKHYPIVKKEEEKLG